ncbi:MAG: hypothetical protein E2O92_06950 [Alphaproteobacteria bacterium]|nr:MAG: hypothetical protein E2O92_06950 [Alphaproteobacteria bacterium]
MLKIVVVLAIATFVVAMGWGALNKWPIDGAVFTSDPWVTVMLTDMMVGFALISVVIYIVEPVKWKALCWIVPLFIVGNGLSGLWLLLNLQKIQAKFSST